MLYPYSCFLLTEISISPFQFQHYKLLTDNTTEAYKTIFNIFKEDCLKITKPNEKVIIGSSYDSHTALYCLPFFLLTALLNFSGCIKEYSYEGGPVQDTLIDTIPTDTIPSDTIPQKEINFSFCDLCNASNELLLSTWSFKYDTFFLCGNMTAAILSPDRTGLTFFGPSACSIDTGLVMTVYLGSPLDSNASNITSHQVIFEYYDNTTLTDIFMTDQLGSFSLTIDSYEYATGIATGTFSGNVPSKNGDIAAITDGKFQIQFK